LLRALATSGHPGKWLTPGLTDVSTDTFRRMNAASDLADWRRRYLADAVGGAPPRDYSSILSLDDALIFEVNLAYGLATDGEGNGAPALTAVVAMYRVNNMKRLWRHEETATDAAGTRSVYDFKLQPQDLVAKWEKLMPTLAQQVAIAYGRSLA